MKLLIALTLGLMLSAGCSLKFSSHPDSYRASAQYRDGEFVNPRIIANPEYWQIIKKYWRGDAIDNFPKVKIPVKPLSTEQINELPNDQLSVVRLGHSSTLIKIAGQLWLVDPVFSQRASPLAFAGPKRFHQPPLSISDLPKIDGLVISHNHYDHLDKHAIEQLRDLVDRFFVPLGLATTLQAWGVEKEKIVEFDWWQSERVGELEVTATPAQHFSGRGIFDRNKTLWAGWALNSTAGSVFYSGDSGYFSGFKEIGERLGPFDLAMLETGAYDTLWPFVHMQPEQSMRASQDVKARHFMPVHNGTFDLAFHPWYEPYQAVTELALQSKVNLITPIVGQPVMFRAGKLTEHNPRWWDAARSAPAN